MMIKSFYWPFRHWVGNQPRLLPLYRRLILGRSIRRQQEKGYANTRRDVLGDTKLVIDGFPGSGNSEATKKILETAVDFDGGIANHLHSSSLVVDAVKRGLPVGVFVRNPKGCVISTLYRFKINELVSPADYLLKLWIQYYRNCQAVQDEVVFCDFSTTISDLPQFTNALNAKFELNLPNELPLKLKGEEHQQRRILTTKINSKAEATEFFEKNASKELFDEALALYEELLESAPHLLKK